MVAKPRLIGCAGNLVSRPRPRQADAGQDSIIESSQISGIQKPAISPPISSSESLPASLAQNQQSLEHANFSDELAERIKGFAYKVRSSGQSLNPISLHNFLSFWISIKNEACEPDVFLCNNGNIQAEWYKNSKRHLVIEFGPIFAICVLIDRDVIWKGKERLLNLAGILNIHSSRPLKWQ